MAGTQKTSKEVQDKLVADLVGQVERRVSSAASSMIADSYADNKKERTSSNRFMIGGGSVLLGLVTTTGSWISKRIDELDNQQKAQVEILEKVEAIEIHLRLLKERQRQLGRRVVSTDIAVSAGFEWLGRKIDAVNRRAKSIKEPRTLKIHRRRATQTAEDQKLDRLFQSDALDVD